MDERRKSWNERQKALRQALTRADDHPAAIELFLRQHAMVHSAIMSQSGLWSFEDEIWGDTTEQAARRIPRDCDHSIVWNIWHIARIEDVVMNMLVAGAPQVVEGENWLERLKAGMNDTGNEMDKAAVAELSAAMDIEVLRAYRVAVGRRSREIVQGLRPEQLRQKIDPPQLRKVLADGVVVEAACGIVDYWSRRTIAGLLLMPPTRHNFIHLNETLRLKRRRR